MKTEDSLFINLAMKQYGWTKEDAMISIGFIVKQTHLEWFDESILVGYAWCKSDNHDRHEMRANMMRDLGLTSASVWDDVMKMNYLSKEYGE